MITFTDSVDGLQPEALAGFFDGWPNPPSTQTHLDLLRRSDFVWLAVEGPQVVGFITAVSDHTLSAYIPLLEVLPEFRGQGIGSELLRRMLLTLGNLYMVDIVCDPATASFYERHSLQRYSAMILRRHEFQAKPGPARQGKSEGASAE